MTQRTVDRLSDRIRRPVTTRVVIGAVLVVVLYRLLVWVFVMRHVPLIGDEDYFWERSRFIVRWFEGRRSGNELERIVNRAWWMPGPMVLAAPIRWLTRDLAIVRLWFGAVDLGLLLFASWAVVRAFGRKIGLGFLLVVGLFPDSAAQSFGIWGEPIAAKLLILALVGALWLIGSSGRSRGRVSAMVLAVGGLLGVGVYFRPPLVLEIAVIGTAIAVLGLARTEVGSRRSQVRSVATALGVVAVAAAIVAPWSIAASDQNGGLVLTTLSVDANAIHVFSNPEDLRAAAGGVGFGDIERLARDRMESEDVSYASALRSIRSEQLDLVSLGDYFDRADKEVELYLDGKLTFLEQYRDLRDQATSSRLALVPHDLLLGLNALVWYPLAWLTAYVMIRSFPLAAHRAFPAFLGKVTLGALFLQPWVSNAKFRHLGLAIPLMVLLVLVAIHAIATEGRADAPTPTRPWMVSLASIAQVTGAVLTIGTMIVYLN